MRLPTPPEPAPLTYITPSLYEALLSCRGKALWAAHGEGDILPRHPLAILGSCFHDVMEAAAAGRLDDGPSRGAARQLFDRLALAAHEASHPLIRTKFPVPEKLPFYSLLRERAALNVERPAAPEPVAPVSPGVSAAPVVETTLSSSDRLIVGRPDKIDPESGELVDFKTGRVAEETAWTVSESEVRQLLLYAYLAAENDIEVQRGTIVRSGGHTASTALTSEDAAAEADKARTELSSFNEAVAGGAGFDDLTQPSPSACRFCPCIPFCSAFWQQAEPSWADEVGDHAEGVVISTSSSVVQEISLTSLEVDVSAGTVASGPAWIEHVPEGWVTADGSALPKEGQRIRVVDGRATDAETPIVIRPDRVMTSVWVLDDSSMIHGSRSSA